MGVREWVSVRECISGCERLGGCEWVSGVRGPAHHFSDGVAGCCLSLDLRCSVRRT